MAFGYRNNLYILRQRSNFASSGTEFCFKSLEPILRSWVTSLNFIKATSGLVRLKKKKFFYFEKNAGEIGLNSKVAGLDPGVNPTIASYIQRQCRKFLQCHG
jgi:hypothetical protein